MNKQRGITLVELMTVLVVIGILTTIAIPSYRGFLLRSQRADATTTLLRVQAAQEKFFVQNNSYADDLASAPPAGLGIPAISPAGYFALRVELIDEGSGFRVIANPRPGGGQSDDTRCADFIVDQNGVKTARDVSGTDSSRECWR